MKPTIAIVTFASLLALTPTSHAQQPEGPPAPPAAGREADAKVSQWIEQLGSDSYKLRIEAEQQLRALGERAMPALREAAEHAVDGEVQWRARRLLRQISGKDGAGLVERSRERADAPEVDGRSDGGRSPDPRDNDRRAAMRDQFDRMFERFEKEFGIDVPRTRFFQDDFFRDLDQQMRQQPGRGHGMSLQIGPDGVRVEVEERGADGEIENKVYEAPDLETFQKQYPDVLPKNGLFGLGFGGDQRLGDALRGRLQPWLPGMDVPQVVPFGPGGWRQDAAASPPPPVGRRLGVVVRDLEPAVREYLELAAGEGLMVDSVQPDSLAAALGLLHNDIVVRIGEVAIGSPADVQRALGAIPKGAMVEVELVRRGQRTTVSANKTEDQADGGDSGKLAPRRAGKPTIR